MGKLLHFFPESGFKESVISKCLVYLPKQLLISIFNLTELLSLHFFMKQIL